MHHCTQRGDAHAGQGDPLCLLNSLTIHTGGHVKRVKAREAHAREARARDVKRVKRVKAREARDVKCVT